MGEIGQLPPAYRITPSNPAAGSGKGNQAPQRKPQSGERETDPRRRRKQDDEDDANHIDEYA